jgi:hypothetical protein
MLREHGAIVSAETLGRPRRTPPPAWHPMDCARTRLLPFGALKTKCPGEQVAWAARAASHNA